MSVLSLLRGILSLGQEGINHVSSVFIDLYCTMHWDKRVWIVSVLSLLTSFLPVGQESMKRLYRLVFYHWDKRVWIMSVMFVLTCILPLGQEGMNHVSYVCIDLYSTIGTRGYESCQFCFYWLVFYHWDKRVRIMSVLFYWLVFYHWDKGVWIMSVLTLLTCILQLGQVGMNHLYWLIFYHWYKRIRIVWGLSLLTCIVWDSIRISGYELCQFCLYWLVF